MSSRHFTARCSTNLPATKVNAFRVSPRAGPRPSSGSSCEARDTLQRTCSRGAVISSQPRRAAETPHSLAWRRRLHGLAPQTSAASLRGLKTIGHRRCGASSTSRVTLPSPPSPPRPRTSSTCGRGQSAPIGRTFRANAVHPRPCGYPSRAACMCAAHSLALSVAECSSRPASRNRVSLSASPSRAYVDTEKCIKSTFRCHLCAATQRQ